MVYNRPVVHPTLWDASKSRNGTFIPMIDFLLYTAMHCTDAEDMIQRIKANDNVNAIIRTEVIETVKEATPECNWDAND